MIDTKWFIEHMQGNRLIVRLHIRPGRHPMTEAHAFSYWVDDMAYNGFKAVYRQDEASPDGRLQLDCEALPQDPNRWPDFFTAEAGFWPEPWLEPVETICSIGTTVDNVTTLPASHPQALVHLARFQAAAALANPNQFTGLSSHWGISLDILARRLEGLVRSEVRGWRRVVGPDHPF